LNMPLSAADVWVFLLTIFFYFDRLTVNRIKLYFEKFRRVAYYCAQTK